MSQLVALLYHSATQRTGLPGIERQLLESTSEALPDDTRRALAGFGPNFDAFLTVRSFTDTVTSGFIGALTLSADEVGFWLDRLARSAEPPAYGQSWDLWPTDKGDYVMFPNDDDRPLALDVCAVVLTGSTHQLRTFTSGLVVERDEVVVTGAPHITTKTCTYTNKIHDPGAPYTGSCRSTDDDCPGGCLAMVAHEADTGRYRITDCSCPG
jgi:hypothetical protein